MAKTIKFNLQLDGNPVRTLEDLRENFNIHDILDTYNNQNLLLRWLEVRGYQEEFKKVREIKSEDDIEICRQLISIFDIEEDEDEINRKLYLIEFDLKKETKLNDLDKKNSDLKSIITKYHNEYLELVMGIQDHPEDFPFIKAAVQKIEKDFIRIFAHDSWKYFSVFNDRSPLAILAVLANDKLRRIIYEEDYLIDKLKKYITRNNGYLMIGDNRYSENTYLSKYIKCYNKATNGSWINLEPNNHRFLILTVGEGVRLRNANMDDEELKATDLNRNFKITSGIDYKTKASSAESKYLYYMEV